MFINFPIETTYRFQLWRKNISEILTGYPVNLLYLVKIIYLHHRIGRFWIGWVQPTTNRCQPWIINTNTGYLLNWAKIASHLTSWSVLITQILQIKGNIMICTI